MSSWNYRVVQRDDEFAIHEVFYADDGAVEGMTSDPVFPRGDTLDDLREEIEHYRAAFDKPTLTYRP
jgi:hypothetical protein